MNLTIPFPLCLSSLKNMAKSKKKTHLFSHLVRANRSFSFVHRSNEKGKKASFFANSDHSVELCQKSIKMEVAKMKNSFASPNRANSHKGNEHSPSKKAAILSAKLAKATST
jgi:hypothetical protein